VDKGDVPANAPYGGSFLALAAPASSALLQTSAICEYDGGRIEDPNSCVVSLGPSSRVEAPTFSGGALGPIAPLAFAAHVAGFAYVAPLCEGIRTIRRAAPDRPRLPPRSDSRYLRAVPFATAGSTFFPDVRPRGLSWPGGRAVAPSGPIP
jgi:hypothetical protein